MRKAVMVLIAFGASSSAAAADDVPPSLETVLVQNNSLDGIWKITAPTYSGGLSVLHGFRGPLRKMQSVLCRIAERTVRCIGPSLMVEGSVSLKGTEAHFAWGSIMARPVIEAKFTSATAFSGVFSFKFSGIAYTAPDPASGTKLNLSVMPPSSDKEGLVLARLLGEIGNGQPSEMLDTQSRDVQVPPQEDLRALGAVQSIVYVAESGDLLAAKDPKALMPRDYKVYDVEFANGERLCGLRYRPDGKIDGFKCI